MQFMLFCCIDEQHWDDLGAAERERVMTDYYAWIEEQEAAGRHRASGKLEPSAAAVTVRNGGSKPVRSDGPFAETKEQIGGFHVIECADRDEAAAIAARIPTLAVGGVVEVRAFEG